MKRTPLLLSLALLGTLSLSPLAAAAEKVPTVEQVCTALTKAAKKQSGKAAKGRLALASALKRLAKEPENVNVGSKGKHITPLMIAAALGEKDAVAWLLSIGADPTVKDAAGKDSFARTKNAAITKQLREAAFPTWEDAIAWLESMNDEEWVKMQVPDGADEKTRKMYEPKGQLCREYTRGNLQTLQKAETGAYVDGHDLGWALDKCKRIAGNLPDFRLYSLLLRQSKIIRENFDLLHCADIPRERQRAFLNLLQAHQVQFTLSGCSSADFAAEKQLHELMLEILPCEPIIVCATGLGDMKDWLKAAVEKGLKEAAESNHMHHRKCVHAAMAKAVESALLSMRLGWREHEELVRYLLSQDLAGHGSPEAFAHAAQLNRLDLLKLLVEAAPTKSFSERVNSDLTLQQSLMYALKNARSEEIYGYLEEQLREVPAATSDTDKQILSHALGDCVKKYEEEQKNCDEQKRYYDGGNPTRLKVVKLLLKLGADPERELGHGTANGCAESDTMKQLLGEATAK